MLFLCRCERPYVSSLPTRSLVESVLLWLVHIVIRAGHAGVDAAGLGFVALFFLGQKSFILLIFHAWIKYQLIKKPQLHKCHVALFQVSTFYVITARTTLIMRHLIMGSLIRRSSWENMLCWGFTAISFGCCILVLLSLLCSLTAKAALCFVISWLALVFEEHSISLPSETPGLL